MTDIVERLRQLHPYLAVGAYLREAADEIERLRAVNAAVCAPSVCGGYWVIYGYARWPSYSILLVPGTLDPEAW